MLDPQKLHDLYAAIGAAVWHLQFLEDALVMYLTMRTMKRPFSLNVANEVLAKQRRRTLGTLLKEAKAAGLLLTETAKAFAVLEERNWLIHQSMHEESDGAYNDANRQKLVARVADLKDRSIALKKALYGELASWCKRQGINVDAAEASALKRFNELRQG